MPQEIQVGRFSGLLHKLLSMREGSPAPYLAPDLIATLVLEADRPEWAWLAGTRLGIGRVFEAANAGGPSSVTVDNPTGSGVLVTVEGIINNDAANEYLLNFTTPAALGAFGSGNQRDTRAGAFPTIMATTVDFTSGWAVAVPGTNLSTVLLLQGVALTWPFVLIPGTALVVGGSAANRAIDIAFKWQERVFEPSEAR